MIKRTALALALGLGLTLGLLWLLVGQSGVALADPGILYVAPGGNCGGATPCYATVQAAVDAASAGDEIRVAAGVYTGVSTRSGVTQTVYVSKTVAIRGGYTTTHWATPDPAANPTILDAQGHGRVFYVTGNISPAIEDLHITGGDAKGLGGSWRGDVGGGIYVHLATAVISGNLIFSNTATIGAGLFLDSSPTTLCANSIYRNVATNSGGGLSLDYSPATLSRNTIYNNSAGSGGGLNVSWSDATLSGNVIQGNAASWKGGGLYLWNSTVMFINNVIADNRANAATAGSALFVDAASDLRLLHTTIARNTGGDGSGIYVNTWEWAGAPYPSTVAMTNTIIVEHTVGITVTAHSTATLNATLWHGNTINWGGAGTINHTDGRSGDPAFASDGYHLTSRSTAIDRGVDAGVTTDIDGDVRPWGAGYDIGADEFREWCIYFPVVTNLAATRIWTNFCFQPSCDKIILA